MYWYRNDGTEIFTEILLTPSKDFDGIWSLFVKDIDGDGDIDILAASGKDNIMVYYLNDGSENFTKFNYTNTFAGAKFRNVHIANLDNDGDEDIAYISNNNDDVIWLENTGTGTGNLIFGAPMFLDTEATGVWGLDVKDMDKDGDLDILISTAQSGTVNTDRISWYENNGAKSFTKHDITTTVDKVRSVFAIDVDDDGDMDFLSSSADDDTVSWYQNNGNQTFTKKDIDTNSDNVQKVTASDVDGDGDIDIMSASGSDDVIALYLNNGSEVFTKKVITNLLDGARAVGTVDLDSDGDLDILAASVNDDFTVYTHLLVDSQGQDLAIQSLPDSDFESIVIPLGVNAISGTALVFTAESINIPNGLDVILEDREEQTFTILSDTNTQYSVTLKDNSNGIGRFYLHTNTQATLGLEIQDLTNVSVYKTSASNLRITGLDIGIASMQLYNTLGQSVFSASFEGASVNNFALPNLKAGIYIVDIKTGSGKLNKKIILQ